MLSSPRYGGARRCSISSEHSTDLLCVATNQIQLLGDVVYYSATTGAGAQVRPASLHTHTLTVWFFKLTCTLGTCAQTLGEEFCSLLRVTNTEEEQPDGTSKTFVSPYTERTRCDCNTHTTNGPAWTYTFLALFSCACCLSLWSWVVQATASYVLNVRTERTILPDRPPCSHPACHPQVYQRGWAPVVEYWRPFATQAVASPVASVSPWREAAGTPLLLPGARSVLWPHSPRFRLLDVGPAPCATAGG